ncbi:tetratricopeptide repeat protein [Pseudodesulfovibrio sediminis]|uniref:Orc1-like AAA ATPase domain-containing protein n=1 Tax=Pseudodesulfovibrio sediminis TaxID=2810563 RepID=A0ABM7P3D9_9BACT|nr:hypothetical protein [Pseudodesulfovibrio sediminis]BCS88169.1 hypothetical protein PSDVSF_14110 [Pseudodesulfovibrio sediminis]
MEQSFLQNTVLPNLPFVDREEHLGRIVHILEDDSASALRIALMDGKGGVGKTEILDRAAAAVSDKCLVVWLSAAQHTGSHKSMIETALDAILNTLDKTSKLGKAEHKKQSVVDFLTGLVPAMKTDAEELIDFAPKTTIGTVQSFIGSAAKYFDFEGLTPRACLNRLLHNIWKSGIKTTFIVDDLHELTRLEGQQLINFFNALEGVQEQKQNWTVFMTSHPIGDHMSNANALSVFWPFRNRWPFEFWTIKGLEDHHMVKLAGLYIENDEVSAPVLGVSDGNPRRFMETIQKLALRDQCSVHNERVFLRGEINDIVVLDNTFERILAEDTLMRHLCGALAIGAEKVPLQVLCKVAEDVGKSQPEYLEHIERLKDLSYFIICENDLGDMCYRLLDDNKKMIVNAVLEEFPVSLFQIHRALVDGYFQCFSDDDLVTMKAMGEPAVPMADEVISKPSTGYFIQASLHATASNYPNSHYLTVASLRILDHFSRYSELISHYSDTGESIRSLFGEKNELTLCVQSLLCKAHYHLGNFDNCVKSLTCAQLEQIEQSEYLFYYAMSIVIAKKDPDPIKKNSQIMQRITSNCFKDKTWEPQIVAAYAFSFQEYGRHTKSVFIYSKYYLKSWFTRNDRGWHTFAMMSPLFLPVSVARIACRSAHDFFVGIGNMRLAGMALHNLGYCELRALNFDKAYRIFDESDRILSANAEEEAGFAKINKAFIHLLSGEAQEAKRLSYDALKHFQSPFYISAARVNLSIADWQLGTKDALDHLDKIPKTDGLMKDPNQRWRIAFNRAFIHLNTEGITPDQTMVDNYYSQIEKCRSIIGMTDFWNNMMAQLALKHPDIRWPKLPQQKSNKWSFINTDLAPFRASTLCFGHA